MELKKPYFETMLIIVNLSKFQSKPETAYQQLTDTRRASPLTPPIGDVRFARADGLAPGTHGDGGVLLLLQRALLLHHAALH